MNLRDRDAGRNGNHRRRYVSALHLAEVHNRISAPDQVDLAETHVGRLDDGRSTLTLIKLIGAVTRGLRPADS